MRPAKELKYKINAQFFNNYMNIIFTPDINLLGLLLYDLV